MATSKRAAGYVVRVVIAEGRAFTDMVFGHQPSAVSHHKIPSAAFSQSEVVIGRLSKALRHC
ncbi:MAG: hypothetical protein ACFCBU_09325 [Cyanophyceae cyanobacterium]